jgi:hypothetical protein
MVQISLSAAGVLLKVTQSILGFINVKLGYSNGANIRVSICCVAQSNAKNFVTSK